MLDQLLKQSANMAKHEMPNSRSTHAAEEEAVEEAEEEAAAAEAEAVAAEIIKHTKNMIINWQASSR